MAQASPSSYPCSAVSPGVCEDGANPRYDSFGKYERTDRASGIEDNGMGTEAIRPIANYAQTLSQPALLTPSINDRDASCVLFCIWMWIV